MVAGARSSLFLPFQDLGLIIVDEEHDLSYKQEDGVVYHARDMAVVRGRLQNAPVILVSATPSLETTANVEAGRYDMLHLPARHGGADLPAISVVDLRRDSPARNCWISPPLKQALADTLAQEEQSLLFLNRRGYAPLTVCRALWSPSRVPAMHGLVGRASIRRSLSVSPLWLHRSQAQCLPRMRRGGSNGGLWARCRTPGRRDRHAVPGSAGRVDDERHNLSPTAAAEIVRRVQAHEIDILIGTQLVAKGHHFPMLTLVGVVDADLGLNGGDLRAAERTYQLLHQVAGRAGREDRPGRVLLQTHHPDHPVMASLIEGARDAFMAAEAEQRQAGNWPPFGRLAAIIVSGPDESHVEGVALALARNAPQAHDFKVLGPAPAPLALLRGRHRRRLLVRATRSVRIQDRLRAWVGTVKPPNSVRVQIDIDPYSFL